MRQPFIKVGLFVDCRNRVYFLDFHEIFPKTFVDPNSLTFQLTTTIVLIRRYRPVHVRLFINVSQFIIFASIFLLWVRPFSTIFGTTDQRRPIHLSILASYCILSFGCVHIQCLILCFEGSIVYLRTVKGILVVVAYCSLLFVYLWTHFWTGGVLSVAGRVLKRFVLFSLEKGVFFLVQRIVVVKTVIFAGNAWLTVDVALIICSFWTEWRIGCIEKLSWLNTKITWRLEDFLNRFN